MHRGHQAEISHKDLKKDAARRRLQGLTVSAMLPAARPRRNPRLHAAHHAGLLPFRTGEVLTEGVKKIGDVWKATDDIRVTDRSLIWNSDLIETLNTTISSCRRR
jgi:succinate dehydrogenase / fumarate reductase flavoprotein subunit